MMKRRGPRTGAAISCTRQGVECGLKISRPWRFSCDNPSSIYIRTLCIWLVAMSPVLLLGWIYRNAQFKGSVIVPTVNPHWFAQRLRKNKL